jgi:hypothetical protein
MKTALRPLILFVALAFSAGSGWGSGQSTGIKTDRKPGYEVGAGLDISILGIFSVVPQARYIVQNFKYRVPGVTTTGAESTQGVNYYTLDLGLSVHNPFGGLKH